MTPENDKAPAESVLPGSASPKTAQLESIFSQLDKIQKQVSLTRHERPMTEMFFEVRERKSVLFANISRAVLKSLSSHDRMMTMIRSSMSREEKSRELKASSAVILQDVLSALAASLTTREKELVLLEIIDEVLGLGPIEQLIRDREIGEIMINWPDFIFIERRGKIELTPLKFQDTEHLMKTVEKILSPVGRRVNESTPCVDARLADGSRVHVAIAPVALNGPLVTIRKFPERALTLDDLIDAGTLSPAMADFLKCCVEGQLNILVSGGTGSGKTTLLNVLGMFIPSGERIVVIEDSAELQIHRMHVNVARLESKLANMEGRGEIPIRELLRNALRMRPDRIVIGEVRGGEAFEMLQAMNTGHDGSLSTAHANSPMDMIHRLEGMCLMAGLDLPIPVIRRMIAGGLNLIIQQNRLKDGTRRMVEISEVAGMEDGHVKLQSLWKFRSTGTDARGRIAGAFDRSAHQPKCLDKLVSAATELNL